ncbi:hypothetical protein [Arthrobacter mobilis]|uniref:Accessory Sec system protein Asp2 n=1 Tax=Arthrobacter mobilis TaxID=2724944 RepID=A0A7X6K7A4_9MICC|nr:hypothetical protein [Arthrobacter mobilis]NKX56475.1 hypothetical protein [Arthrobacter mobilis]
MAEQELDFVSGGVVVQYKRRAARQDRRHLVVMFAGIRPLDSYEFDGRASRDSQAHWLWLKDKFDGQHAYYLCRNLDFGIERAVIALIDGELERLGLTRSQCTLAGFSKGGFAALYLGIKYGFRNIVASAPQVYVGTHTRTNRPKIFAHLSGGGGDREQVLLDSLVPDAVAADQETDRNIYLFSSPQDQFHQAQIVPALPMFAKYANFNYIETDSDLVNEHTDVTRYNVPLILATLYALADNVAPRYGTVRNGNRLDPATVGQVLLRQQERGDAVANLTSGRLSGSVFFPEGVGFLRGHAVRRWEDLAATLVLAGNGTRHEFRLGGNRDAGIGFRYFEDAFCDYRLAAFSSPKKAGIDLGALPPDTYCLQLQLAAPDRTVEVPLRSDTGIGSESQLGGRLFRFRADGGRAVLDIRPVLGAAPGEACFRLRSCSTRGPLLHLAGDFAVRGVEILHRQAARYYLVLHGTAGVHSFELAPAARRGEPDPFGDGLSDYSWAGFGTRRDAGVDLSALAPGTYDAAVSLSCAGGLYTLPAGRSVQITASGSGVTAAVRQPGPESVLFRAGLGRLRPAVLRQRAFRRPARRS